MEFLANLHPIVIHFPIVLFIAYFAAEVGSLIIGKEWLNKLTVILLGAGVFFSVLSVLTGNQAYEIIKPVLRAKQAFIEEAIVKHEQLATLTLWYFFALLIFRVYLLIKKHFSHNWKIVFCILSLLGVFLVVQTGLLGGKLVYDFGIGTKLFIK